MRRILLAGATVLALSAAQPTLAADAPVYKGPAPYAVALFNWSGFYIGVHGGGAWSNGTSSADPIPSPIAWNRSADSFDLRGNGGLLGLHAGYNWQVAPSWLFGVEGDWSWTNVKASASALIRNPAGVPFVPNDVTTMSRDLNWLASVRARLGLVVNNLLLYGTGGVAWGNVNFGGTTNSVPPGFVWAANLQNTAVGFVVGGGAEWRISENWLLRGEYLFYRLSGQTALVNGVPPFPPFQILYTWNNFDTHVARVGLSYKFGS